MFSQYQTQKILFIQNVTLCMDVFITVSVVLTYDLLLKSNLKKVFNIPALHEQMRCFHNHN